MIKKYFVNNPHRTLSCLSCGVKLPELLLVSIGYNMNSVSCFICPKCLQKLAEIEPASIKNE